MIHIRTPNIGAFIRLRNEDVFCAVTDRLWRSVGIRLLSEHVDHLTKGGRLIYPGVVIQDNAVTLTRKRLLKSNEEIRITWDNARILSTDRYLVFSSKYDNKVCGAVSYVKTDNICVLENMLDLMVASGKFALSAIQSKSPNAGAT